jgi:hypothetical protein
VNFPGAVLLKGDDPQPDFYWSPNQTTPPGWGIGYNSSPVNGGGAVPTVTTQGSNGSTASLTYALSPVSSISNYTFADVVNSGLVPVQSLNVLSSSASPEGPWYWLPPERPDPERALLEQLAAMSRPLSRESVQLTAVEITAVEIPDPADVAQEPPTPDASDAEAQSPEPALSPAATQSHVRLHGFRVRRAEVTAKRLTGLAVFIAGQNRAVVSAEWRSHLSGESGTGLPSRRQARESAGFVLAAVRYRLQDAADLAWRPVDILLESRELSNLTVVLATLVIAVFFLHRGGLNDLANNLVNVAVVPASTLAAIHGGRRYRQVKPPKRRSRRRSELVRRKRSSMPGSARTGARPRSFGPARVSCRRAGR